MIRISDFTCAICERHQDGRWNFGRPSDALPPLCRYCETFWGPRNQPSSGAMMDRRLARQVMALAEALHTKAKHQDRKQAWRAESVEA